MSINGFKNLDDFLFNEKIQKFNEYIDKLVKEYPIQYIINKQEFILKYRKTRNKSTPKIIEISIIFGNALNFKIVHYIKQHFFVVGNFIMKIFIIRIQ